MNYEDDILSEINELDELNEEPTGEYISDDEIFNLDELSDRMLGVTSLLNHIDQYKQDVSKKRRETDWKILDILHKLEDNIDDMTIYGFIKVILKLHDLRELRRTLKVSDSVIYEFQKNTSKLNNEGNRKLLDHAVMKEMNQLTKPYRNRVYTTEELDDMFKATELTPEELSKVNDRLISFQTSEINEEILPTKKKRGRPRKSQKEEVINE